MVGLVDGFDSRSSCLYRPRDLEQDTARLWRAASLHCLAVYQTLAKDHEGDGVRLKLADGTACLASLTVV